MSFHPSPDPNQDSNPLVIQKTKEIKVLISRTAQNIIDIGQKLLEVKQILGHGNFGDWLKREFQWSVATATKMMQASQQFKNVDFTNLNVSPSALYLLAAPSIPESAREEALNQAKKGVPITYSLSKELVRRHCFSEKPSVALSAVASKNTQGNSAVDSSLKQTSLALLKADVLSEIEAHLSLDSLVKTDYFVAYLAREWRRMLRNQQSLALVCCQITQFSQLIELQQEDAIAQLSQIIVQNLKRPADLGTYITEGRFWLVFPETDVGGVVQVLKEIRQQVHTLDQDFISADFSVNFTVCCVIPSQDMILKEIWELMTQKNQKIGDRRGVIQVVGLETS